MDHAVSLVQAYLRCNGFLTVTEYPILHRNADGTFREATDLDVLAVRLPGAGRVLPRPTRTQGQKVDVDPLLDLDHRRHEYVVAEVKEGEANPNRFLFNPGVLHEALRRFGLGDRDQQRHAVHDLRQHGEARLDGGRIRLLVFGARPGPHVGPCTFIPLGHVTRWLRDYVRASWATHGTTRFRDPALSFIALLEKADGHPGTPP